MSTTANGSKVILITGCSAGLGLCLTRSALAHGHKVIATSRNPAKTPDLVSEAESKGGAWLPLDMASADLPKQFEAALAVHGKIDVLINNAGYGRGGAFEDETIDNARHIFETNFFGVLRLTQLVLPHMRKQASGTIVNVTSAVVTENHPGLSLYSASKWALEGFSETLRSEVAAFGIKVMIVVPGGMRTNFTSPEKAKEVLTVPSEAYKESAVGYVLNRLQEVEGKQSIDPQRAAERIIEAVDGKVQVGKRLPIGAEPIGTMTTWAKSFLEETESLAEVAKSCEFPEGE